MKRILVIVLVVFAILPNEIFAQQQGVTVKLTLIAKDGNYPTPRFTITYYESNDNLKEIKHHGNGLLTISNVKPNSLMKVEVKDADQPPPDWNIYFWATETERTVQFNVCSSGTCSYTYYYISSGTPSSGGGQSGQNGTTVFLSGLVKFIEIGYDKLTIEYTNKTVAKNSNITFYQYMATNFTNYQYQFNSSNNFMFNYTRSDVTKSYWVFVHVDNSTYNYFWGGKISDIDKLKNFLQNLNNIISNNKSGIKTPLSLPLLIILLILGLSTPSNYHIILNIAMLVMTVLYNLSIMDNVSPLIIAFLVLQVIAASLIIKYNTK